MFKSEVIGSIGKDAVIRTINNREYYEINVAHHRDKGSIWVRCHYRRTSDKLDNKLVKGAQVFLRGDLEAGVFTRRDGSYDLSLDLWATELQITRYANNGNQQQVCSTNDPQY